MDKNDPLVRKRKRDPWYAGFQIEVKLELFAYIGKLERAPQAAQSQWTRAAISADVARSLGVMRAERALATEQFRRDALVRSHER